MGVLVGERELRAERTRQYATTTFLRGALVSLGLTLLAGLVAVLYYVPAAFPWVRSVGLEFAQLRPLHTTFASAWIFLGGLAVVHRYLQERGGLVSKPEKFRLLVQVLCWGAAGAGIFVSLLNGVFSGREYMGYHPSLSILIAVGWVCFGWNFFRITARGFLQQPIYVTMWGVGVCFFLYTFAEQHLWLIPGVFEEPLVDTRLQWKACGTLVGSFNLFVYGTLYYVGEKLTEDRSYAQSRLAYSLFGVGLLNSFTNFAHHTYHLPQSHAVKWISFVISMIEIIILARVLFDLSAAVKKARPTSFHATRFFLSAAKWWTMAIIGSALLLSIPPLNALVHGTHVVTGHAMGSEIGIDSMALFAAVSFLLGERLQRRQRPTDCLDDGWVRTGAIGVNVASATLVTWLTISGSITGYYRYLALPAPAWLGTAQPYLFAGAGGATALFLVVLLWRWLPLAFLRRAAWAGDREPAGVGRQETLAAEGLATAGAEAQRTAVSTTSDLG
ncbi:MAG: cbb3-type cytochrome c oxidase subunit I [Planctomycetota bacterium]